MLVICLAELRVRLQWQRWEHQAQQQQETKETSDVGKAASAAALGGSSDGGSSGSLGGAAADCLEAGQAAGAEGLPAAAERPPGARRFCGGLLKAAAWLREAAICCLQALLPNTGAALVTYMYQHVFYFALILCASGACCWLSENYAS